MRSRYNYALAWIGLWLGLFLITLYCRPLLPISETRYAAVAWEMWLRDSFVVPYFNGETYSHKPPLLFWIIHLGWWLFGVHEWVVRSVPALFGLGSLFLTASIARRLWPDDLTTSTTAPLIVLSSVGWAVFTTALLFDTLIAFLSLLGLLGILSARHTGGYRGWIILGLAIGLGVLAKGPVILIYTLPVALLAPWWIGEEQPPIWKDWYRGILVSIGLATIITLSWALPAAWLGGTEYRYAIFWGQTAGRVIESFAHRHPWWWYLPWLPLLLFPWFSWLSFWRGLIGIEWDTGLRFCLAWSLSGLLALSLISGKQIHYLLPLFPPFALFAARISAEIAPKRYDFWFPAVAFILMGCLIIAVPFAAHRHLPAWANTISPFWGAALIALGMVLGLRGPHTPNWNLEKLALACLAAVAIVNVGVIRTMREYYDGTEIGQHLAMLQAQNLPLAHIGKYYGQFQFIGRLEKPIEVIQHAEVQRWARSHPSGRLITYSTSLNEKQATQAEFYRPYRARYLLILTSRALLADPTLWNPALELTAGS
jgi:4-amino-4-deoxy-L-arabinose transferase-like glycosyltransferase